MTDKEIYQLVASVLEMNQQHEELHLMQEKLLHGRINNLQKIIGLQCGLAAHSEVEEVVQLSGQLVEMLDGDSVPDESRRLIAKIESSHENIAALLATLRAKIEAL